MKYILTNLVETFIKNITYWFCFELKYSSLIKSKSHELIARSLKTNRVYELDYSVNGYGLMMLKKILDSYQDDIYLSRIIGLGGDGVVLKKTVAIDGQTQELAVKYTRWEETWLFGIKISFIFFV